ncbi:NAD(P)-binding protein [Auricularia subglabra TFB-10046 SS5]|nr:NAD(P)-binding protein [Auricularia subglabra TFB-10046 SS5]
MILSPLTVVVHGATGLQGGAVVRELSAAGHKVRAAVRDTQADKAKQLAALTGVKLVVVDLNEAATIEKAYAGSDAVYAYTVPGADEESHGRQMVDLAIKAGVKHFVWSTLESIEKATHGALTSANFDVKARVAEYIHSRGAAFPATLLFLGGFLDNYTTMPGSARSTPEGTIVLTSAGAKQDTVLKSVWIKKDLGCAVRTILEHRDAFVGQSVALADCVHSPRQQADIVAKITGREASVFEISFPPEMKDFANMAQFANEYGLLSRMETPDQLLKSTRGIGFGAAILTPTI